MDDSNFFLKFEIQSPSRFDALERMAAAIQAEKDRRVDSEEYDPQIEWMDYLDSQAIDWFCCPFDANSDEEKTYNALWKLTSPKYRNNDPMFAFPGHWDFDSMIDALLIGEYRILGVQKKPDGSGLLTYDPWAGPFGGTESMVALIESFGQYVTYDSWHKGPHRRIACGWNYELAKKLVALNQGYTPGCDAMLKPSSP